QRWSYTIYPTGQIIAAIEATVETESWSPPRVALAVTFSSASEEQVQTRIEGVAAGAAASQPGESSARATIAGPAFAAARSVVTDSLLLFVPYPSEPNTRVVEHADAVRRRTSFVALDDAAHSKVRKWVCAIVLAAAAGTDDAEVLLRATDYTTPGPLRIEIGRPPTAGDAVLRRDGFNPAGGTFVIATEQNRARFTLDGRERPSYSPAFEVVGGRGAQSWVYVDHLIFEPVWRPLNGQLVFQLPGIVRKPVMIETLFRHDEHGTPP
ncbi:MAG: hypothetical protein Q7R41_13220, partial [Phycisphaerales bacterium]|nr:hypothetical protein [Phycisphaerales bacterium]